MTPLLLAALLAGSSALPDTDGAEDVRDLVTPVERPRVRAADAVSARQLSIMVLPPSQLAGLASGLELDDDDSGVQANADVANDGPRKCRTPAALGRMGRITGYGLDYQDDDLSRVKEGAGVVGVESRVDLYRDQAGASKALRRHLADERRQVGLTLGGVTFERLDTFDVKVADEALGFRERSRIGPYRGQSATIVLRVGRLVGVVDVRWVGGHGYEREVADLSRRLTTRIAAVLAGRVREDPVTIPTSRVPAPLTGPDLSAMALRASDLGSGAWVTSGEYVQTGGAARYERDLDAGCGGAPTFVRSTVTLGRDVEQARRAFASESATLDQAATLVLQGQGRAIGLFAPARSEPLGVGRAGEERRAVRVVSRGVARSEFAFAVVRVGRAVGVLVLGRALGAITDREATELVGRLARRMQDGLPAP